MCMGVRDVPCECPFVKKNLYSASACVCVRELRVRARVPPSVVRAALRRTNFKKNSVPLPWFFSSQKEKLRIQNEKIKTKNGPWRWWRSPLGIC